MCRVQMCQKKVLHFLGWYILLSCTTHCFILRLYFFALFCRNIGSQCFDATSSHHGATSANLAPISTNKKTISNCSHTLKNLCKKHQQWIYWLRKKEKIRFATRIYLLLSPQCCFSLLLTFCLPFENFPTHLNITEPKQFSHLLKLQIHFAGSAWRGAQVEPGRFDDHDPAVVEREVQQQAHHQQPHAEIIKIFYFVVQIFFLF